MPPWLTPEAAKVGGGLFVALLISVAANIAQWKAGREDTKSRIEEAKSMQASVDKHTITIERVIAVLERAIDYVRGRR